MKKIILSAVLTFMLGACCPRYETESYSRISFKDSLESIDAIATKRQIQEKTVRKDYLEYMEEEIEKRIEILTSIRNTLHNLEALISRGKEDEARILMRRLKENLGRKGDSQSQAILNSMPWSYKKLERESVIDYLTPLNLIGDSLLCLTSAPYHLEQDNEKSPKIPYYRKLTPNRRVTEIEIGK